MGMPFSVGAFNQFLGQNGQVGQQYAWYQSSACPCADPYSGQADPACPLCSGKGKIYAAPVTGVAALAGQRAQKDWATFGQYEAGDLVLTIPQAAAIYGMGQWDRVTALNTQQVFSHVLTAGSPLEKLWASVLSLTAVFWRTADGTGIIKGDLPTLNPDGSINWSAASVVPEPGTQYTISGVKMLDYYCWGMYPTNRNFQQGLQLPRKVILRDWDLFSR